MVDLGTKIALVTGASRGVGRGVALGLGEAGATVYVTGRTERPDEAPADLRGTIHQTAADTTDLGGKGVAIRCDHTDDVQVEAVFHRIRARHGRLDILVNNVWGGYERMVEGDHYTWELPFWEQPMWRWEAMFRTGLRASFLASRLAARLMIPQHSGLIVNISYWAAQKHLQNVIYGLAKSGTDRMTADTALELRPHDVAVVSLYPGLVRTERVMRAAEFLNLGSSESPQFIGRAVAALAADPEIMDRSGQVLVAAELALEYGFTDIDGAQPRPLTLDDI